MGHIPRTVAAKLAKYIDNGSLLVEGSLSGNVGRYDCPLQLKLFGTNDPFERAHLRTRMKADRLPCHVLDQRENDARDRRRHELKKVAAAKKAAMLGSARGMSGSQQWEAGRGEWAGNQYPGDGLSGSQSLEQIIENAQMFNPREMGDVVENFGLGEEVLAKMPMTETPKKLATRLLPYQRQALHWLLEKEDPQLPLHGSEDAVQLWKASRQRTDVYYKPGYQFLCQGHETCLGQRWHSQRRHGHGQDSGDDRLDGGQQDKIRFT